MKLASDPLYRKFFEKEDARTYQQSKEEFPDDADSRRFCPIDMDIDKGVKGYPDCDCPCEEGNISFFFLYKDSLTVKNLLVYTPVQSL